ncbi:MAG: hypothetical protein IJ220_00285 [Clostridia bacterium]|nr:hypothetical protein [Clostridia bacterium]
MKDNYLLTDEKGISEQDYLERKLLVSEFKDLPEEFFSKLRHFQPQIGCLNGCKICSKFAGARVEFWSEARLRNIIAALKYASPQKDASGSVITYDRKEHRNSVIFPYLDNDIGNYPYLKQFIDLAYCELGVTTRISTVSYSRHNNELNEMHKSINEHSKNALGGVRLSFTPYEIGWEVQNGKFSRLDYIFDMANLLSIYKPYFYESGAGSRNMCVEIRYKPLVKNSSVYVTDVLGHIVICTGNYLWISRERNIEFVEAQIADPYNHNIVLSEKPQYFYSIDLYKSIDNIEEVKKISHKFIISNLETYRLVEVYMMKNYDGEYYTIEPSITEEGNFGINVYPITEKRYLSGYIITERFFLNSLIKYKKIKKLNSLDEFPDATWKDIYEVLALCEKSAIHYKEIGKNEKYEYIINEVLPMINAYVSCLQMAGFKPKDFFDYRFSIDTGIICNLGRALTEFRGLTNKENEPLTPVHERNYGMHNSKMTQEGVSWRLSCNYNNTIIVEKLNMFDTASEKGQVSFRKIISLHGGEDEIYSSKDLEAMYLVPGQRIQ